MCVYILVIENWFFTLTTYYNHQKLANHNQHPQQLHPNGSGLGWSLSSAFKGSQVTLTYQSALKITGLDISDVSAIRGKNYIKTKAFTRQHFNTNFIITFLSQIMILSFFYNISFKSFTLFFGLFVFLVIL